jgi:hypothetical protein
VAPTNGVRTSAKVEKTGSKKIAALRQELNEVRQQYHEREFDWIDKDKQLREAQIRIAEFENTLARRSNVTPISKRATPRTSQTPDR